MKLELDLEVSQTQIFDLLTASILKDIKDTTGVDIPVERIQQYQYTKSIVTKVGATNSVEVEITSYIVPEVYEAKVVSATGDYTFRYDIQAIDDNHCHVTYFETFFGNRWNLRLNYLLFSWLYKNSSLRRLEASIRQMEWMILNPEEAAAQMAAAQAQKDAENNEREDEEDRFEENNIEETEE